MKIFRPLLPGSYCFPLGLVKKAVRVQQFKVAHLCPADTKPASMDACSEANQPLLHVGSSRLKLLNPIYRDSRLNYSMLQWKFLQYSWGALLYPPNSVCVCAPVKCKSLHSTLMSRQGEWRCCGSCLFSSRRFKRGVKTHQSKVRKRRRNYCLVSAQQNPESTGRHGGIVG